MNAPVQNCCDTSDKDWPLVIVILLALSWEANIDWYIAVGEQQSTHSGKHFFFMLIIPSVSTLLILCACNSFYIVGHLADALVQSNLYRVFYIHTLMTEAAIQGASFSSGAVWGSVSYSRPFGHRTQDLNQPPSDY